MDQGLTVPKWVLIVWPKISQMPQNLSAPFVCHYGHSLKVLDFIEKMVNLASVVRVYMYTTEKCKYTAITMIPQPL